jgi:UDPglucose--hexose-1-phosphate uridylyltransferase
MPEYRFDPFQNRWVILAETRSRRPSNYVSGAEKKDCPFCRGNESMTPPEITAIRKNNGSFEDLRVRIVSNKFPAVVPNPDPIPQKSNSDFYPYTLEPGQGAHEVIIETPRHGVDLDALPWEKRGRFAGSCPFPAYCIPDYSQPD